jgi:hypothetical protein
VAESFYVVLEESAAEQPAAQLRVRSTGHTNGPWGPGLQHAGPPAALLARAVRRLGGGPADALAARLCFDVLAPVPVAELVVAARMLRAGRRVALAEATLAPAEEPERPVMTLRAWLLRRSDRPDGAIPATPTAPAPAEAAAAPPMRRPAGWHPGYLDAIEWRWVDGAFEAPGPATVWTRMRVDLVDTEPIDPMGHLVAVSDSASGISAVASPRALLFVNTDLTLHLTRVPQGGPIWMHAETVLDPHGAGRTSGRLGDAAGLVATSAQSLFVEPRG